MQRDQKLDLLMQLCGLGQNECADLCGMDKAAMSRIASHQHSVDPICALLGHRAAEKLSIMASDKQQVESAKGVLVIDVDIGRYLSFDEWLGMVRVVPPVIMEESERTAEKQVEQEAYSHDHMQGWVL